MDPPIDPGGTTPQVSANITIPFNNSFDILGESSMDTDGSSVASSKRKRVRGERRICKHCNKKRRRHTKGLESKIKDSDCQCIEDENQTLVSIPVVNNTESVKPASPPSTLSRTLYNAEDVAPYVVHVQKNETHPNDNTTLHPIAFGRFLHTNKINNIVNGSLKRIGRNRLSLSFSNFENANAFLNNSNLETHNFKAFIPSFHVTRMGIVRGIPKDWTEEEVIQNISVPIGCGKILKTRRIKKKTINEGQPSFINTETIVITFDGQILPKRVFMFYTSLTVDLYIYPTIQCYNCCRFGHVKMQCRSNPRCYKCRQNHTGDKCEVDEENVSCILCNGSHSAISKKCPEYARQKAIKETMAHSCVSYAEASKFHPPTSKLYSDVLTSSSPSNKSHFQSSFLKEKSSLPHIQSSHKKTVTLKPRSPQKAQQGYDRSAHEAIVKEYNIPAPSNGCALSSNNIDNNQSIFDIILMLIKVLSQSKMIQTTLPPSNDAIYNVFSQLLTSHNGLQSPNNSVELS